MAIRRRSRVVIAIALALFLVLVFRPVPYRLPELASGYRQTTSKPIIGFKKSSFDWSTVREHHPAESPIPFRKAQPRRTPRIQYNFDPTYRDDATNERRREAVRDAFVRSWQSYKQHAWLRDELMPITGGAKDTFGGWAATLVDSLDTLWVMNLKDDFYEAARAAAAIDWGRTSEKGVNLFETTIRHLGGLLSAYDLSGEHALLLKAKELGDMLYMAFDTPNRLPGFWLTFEDAKVGTQLAGTHDPSASPASLSLEFIRLAQLTGEGKYFDAVERVRRFLERSQEQSLLPGMWPTMINFQAEDVRTDNAFTLGALADSLYEYLLKTSILVSGAESSSYEKMYRRAMEVVSNHVLFRPMLQDNNRDLLFSGTAVVDGGSIRLVPEGQHLSCFAGGMFALGGKVFGIEEHIRIGEQLTLGCAWAGSAFPTGLMPEIFNLIECHMPSLKACPWDVDRWEKEGDHTLTPGFRNARDPRYILRPEAIESVFILYRISGKEHLRDLAWTMFESIMNATKTDIANAAVKDVTTKGITEKEDSMESFWLAETLKYFYLIFSPPDIISLDKFVFNTEAHPLKRPE